jgi:protein FRA10AC1
MFSLMSRRQERNPPSPRNIQQITSNADRAELERHYTFLPAAEQRATTTTTTWQDRVVQHYHSHLYKEYVLADLTRPGQVGLRWRIREEVEAGKGHTTCGNKHCQSQHDAPVSSLQLLESSPKIKLLLRKYYGSSTPTTESEEHALLEKLPYGIGLVDFEVPFSYVEHGEAKEELVKLRLCLRCAPLLFRKKNGVDPALQARIARDRIRRKETAPDAQHGTPLQTAPGNASVEKHQWSSSEPDSSDEEQRRRRKKRRKRERKRSQERTCER